MKFESAAFSGDNIIFKFIESNGFALVTVRDEDVVVRVVNGVSGRVIYQYFEKRVDLKHEVDVAFSEHYLVLSFVRIAPSGLNQQEITVTELYEQRQESDTKKLLTEYYKGEERFYEHEYSSFAHDNPEVAQETYILPFFVKAIVLTQT
mmetsp:Transcript_34527/g.25620  ORF Transcript_34527/g.25620 Transcript_34527/m.25620 type:complete len:149 (-) Transcript_34527:500-946(-)